MPSQIVTATSQAALLSALSNLLAQGLKAYRNDETLSLDIVAFAQFVFWTLVSCPPNFLWQQYIEERFPAYTAADGTKALNIPNTATKFLLDQSIGAMINTAAFLAVFAAFKGKPVQREVRRETLPLMVNGWKIWPIVSILNFTVVPFHNRILVGSVVGLFWGIYLSIIAGS